MHSYISWVKWEGKLSDRDVLNSLQQCCLRELLPSFCILIKKVQMLEENITCYDLPHEV